MRSSFDTDRLTIRYVADNDVAAIQAVIVDPRIYRNVARIAADQQLSKTKDWIAGHPDGRVANTDYVYAILCEEQLIGVMGLHRPTVSDPFELGYWLSPSAWGKGYATEAGKAMLFNLEQSAGPQKTVSGHFIDNLASGRVLEKLGFVRVGKNEIFCAGRDQMVPHIQLERVAS